MLVMFAAPRPSSPALASVWRGVALGKVGSKGRDGNGDLCTREMAVRTGQLWAPVRLAGRMHTLAEIQLKQRELNRSTA